MTSRLRSVLVVAIATLAAAFATAPVAHGEVPFEFEPGAQALSQTGPGANLAGAHPDVTLTFRVRQDPVSGLPGQAPNSAAVELPAGMVGDLRALDVCAVDDVIAAEKPAGAGRCPRRAAAGVAQFDVVYPNGGGPPLSDRRLWRVPAGPGEVAAFASSVVANPVRIAIKVTPSGGYRVRATADRLPQSAAVRMFSATLWGVPADHQGLPATNCDGVVFAGTKYCIDGKGPTDPTGNPAIRFGGPLADADRVPFLSNPSVCGASLDGFIRLAPYGTEFGPIESALSGGTVSGCELQPLSGSVDVTPASRQAGQPSGYTVGLDVRQNADPDGVAAAHVKDVELSLPEGVAISPSSANGLDACTDAQLEIGGDSEPACPAASRIGSVIVESPAIEETLTGDAYVGSQRSQDPASGEMYRLFIVARARGVLVKLAGGVSADPQTGRLTARFEDNPQLPFNRIELRLDDGERASLVNPRACGELVSSGRLDSWSGKAVDLSASTTIDQGCGPRGFDPSFVAGTENPVAGESSAFSGVVARGDGSQQLRTLDEVKLPEGLLGHVSKVDVCAAAQADAGTCGDGSRVGHVQVAAGPGSSPVWVPQQGKAPTSVSLAGPYEGAPYSLSVVVPAQAGPFDLGRIVVRAPLDVDRLTAQLSTRIAVSRVFDSDGRLDQVVEGAMPTIVKGIPLQVREVRVVVDRDGFTVNPTSCEASSVDATLGSDGGQSRDVSSRFQVGECASLGFSPRLGMRLLGKRQTSTGKHPALRTVLTQPDGQANIGLARVVMPRSIVLDPENSVDPELVCDYDTGQSGECGEGSVIGKARAVSPLLKKPLTGKVHLVQGIRFGPTGNRIRTTPSILVKLRGEVDIDLYGRTTVHAGRLVTVFKNVPDARVKRFGLRINGGPKGILVVTGSRQGNIDICDSRQTANLAFTGHNGKKASYRRTVRTPCAKASKTRKAQRNNNR